MLKNAGPMDHDSESVGVAKTSLVMGNVPAATLLRRNSRS
jgi:hypothetical protein